MCLQYKSFENTVGKGEIACNEQFLLFPVFSLFFKELSFIFTKFEIVVSLSVGKNLKFVVWERVNSLPNDKILDATKLKAFADDKINIAKMTISLHDRVENNVEKGENAGIQHFLLFSVFSKAFFFRIVKSRDCVVKSYPIIRRRNFRLVQIETID